MTQIDQGFAPGLESPKEQTHPGNLRRLFSRLRSTISVTNASNASPIVITTGIKHFLSTGDQVTIVGVTGTLDATGATGALAANGTFTITAIDDTTFSLDQSAGNGTYEKGGSVVLPTPAHVVLEKGTKLGTLNEFISTIDKDVTVVKPIRSLLLGAHANEQGQIQLKLYRNQQPSPNTGDLTDFDALESTLPPQGQQPDLKKTIAIPSDLMGTAATSPPHFVHLRGCSIGQAPDFLTEWQKAQGGTIEVTAPQFLHGVAEVNNKSPTEYGSWEYFQYDFIVRSPGIIKNRAPDPEGATVIHTRDDLIAAFKADDPFTKGPRTFIAGTSDGTKDIDPALWDEWLPSDISRTDKFPLRNNLFKDATGNPDTGRRATLLVQKVLFVNKERFRGDSISFPNNVQETPPTTFADFKAFWTQVLVADAGHDPSRFTPEHDFPIYRRLGYPTVEDMVDGYSWNFAELLKKKPPWKVIGDRTVYHLTIPISDPNPGPDLNKSITLFNFFPDAASTHPVIVQIPQDDSRVFVTSTPPATKP